MDSLTEHEFVKPEKLYQELKELAEKIGIRVSEQNFRTTTGIRVQSGFCKVKDQDYCIIDRHLRLTRKMEVLAECISTNAAETIEGIFVVPAVREYMDRFRPMRGGSVSSIAKNDLLEGS